MVKNFAARKGEKGLPSPTKKKGMVEPEADIRGRSALHPPVVNWITGRSRGYKMDGAWQTPELERRGVGWGKEPN